MAIYDYSGNELTTIFDYAGNELDIAYDYSGDEIFSGIEPVTIDEVSEIFQSACTDAMDYINNLPDGYVNYIILTDTHYATNFGHSANVANYLYSSGKFDKLIHLGDLLNDTNVGESDWQNMIDANLLHYGGRWLFAQGNHDAHIIPLSAAEEVFLPQNVHHAVDYTYNPPYYWDSKKAKIRFLVIHHGSAFNTTEAVNWIHYRPDSYKWALLQHAPWNNGEWEDTSCNVDGNWLHDLIDSESGFIGNFCGHLHLDSMDNLQTPNGTSYNQMTFDCDTKGGQADDINGQVITIVSINPVTENVKFYRIGRSNTYESKQWEYTGFTV